MWLLIVCVIVSFCQAEEILFTGFNDRELPEFQQRFEERVYQVWGRDTLFSLVDREFAAYVKDKRGSAGRLLMTDSLAKFLEGHGYGDMVIAVPALVAYDLEPRRAGFLTMRVEVRGRLKIQYSFYDTRGKRELYITEVVTERTLRKGILLPWKKIDDKGRLSAVERLAVTKELLDESVFESEKILKEVLRIKKGNRRIK